MSPQVQESVQTLDHPHVRRIRSLLNARGRAKRNEIILEDDVNIRGALEAGLSLPAVFVAERRSSPSVLDDVPEGTPVIEMAQPILDAIFEATRVPTVFAIVRLPPRPTLRSLVETSGDIVVLDDLVGPGNIGSIIRIATAFGHAGIVLLNEQRMQIYRRGIVRASTGSMFKIPLVTAKTESFVRFCNANGIAIVVTSPHAGMSVADLARRRQRLAVVFGNEAHGCARALGPHAAAECRIPISPRVESLNVSAAASVILYARSAPAGLSDVEGTYRSPAHRKGGADAGWTGSGA